MPGTKHPPTVTLFAHNNDAMQTVAVNIFIGHEGWLVTDISFFHFSSLLKTRIFLMEVYTEIVRKALPHCCSHPFPNL